MSVVDYTAEQKAAANGIEIAWDAFGNPDHPALLLIAGLGVQLTDWDALFCRDLAAHGLYVIRFDNRDIGRSTGYDDHGRPNVSTYVNGYLSKTPIEAPYTLHDMAADTVGLLDAIGIEQAHIVGVSMGGMIAQLVAIEHPERVSTLTLIMTSSGEYDLPGPHWKLALPRIRRPFPQGDDATVKHIVGVLVAMNGSVHATREAQLTKQLRDGMARNLHPDGKERQLWAISGTAGRRDALGYLTMPTLVIHGDEDPLIPLACGIDLASAIPEAKLVIIEGLGHCLPPSISAQMMREITQLAGVRPLDGLPQTG